MTLQQVQTGIEVLRANDFAALRGKRVGLLTNPSAVDSDFISTYDILRRASQVNLIALFSPEHGLAAAAADGETVASSTDPATGLPVFSLYGKSERPTPDMLAAVDVIVCDIQDIGTRYYTFTWTISHVLEAAGENGVEVMILDRPNPLGNEVSGASLDMQLRSLVGRFPVPTQHGMTLGELSQMINQTWNKTAAAVTVTPCGGYQPGMRWQDTGLPFVIPSPNMPHLVTAQHYPGSCLVEGTSLSEGRGTALPFEIAGSPELDGAKLAGLLNAQAWSGVRFREHVFKPSVSKHAGVTCQGVQAHITDLQQYRPLEVWLGVLKIIYHEFGFTWNDHFERLIGTAAVRPLIESGASLTPLFEEWQSDCADFAEQRKPFLLYK